MSEFLDNRKRANYAGDRRTSVGQVMGPNTTGEALVVDEAIYDSDADRTTLIFRYATQADFAAAARA